jgi:UDP-N-acetyl-D-mannosaminuronic acid transferase (WecB/TagA/CpsF family)
MEEEHAADVAAINEARPDFVWVGLGMPPKQEKWMASHVGRIDSTPRQSLGMQRSGLEWLFRLVSEPVASLGAIWSTIQFSWPVRYNSAQAGNPTLRTGERFPRRSIAAVFP